jgi:hypothetical protein
MHQNSDKEATIDVNNKTKNTIIDLETSPSCSSHHHHRQEDDQLWIRFRNEFRRENFSLSFEKNSLFMRSHPEDVLEYFHSSIVSFFFF